MTILLRRRKLGRTSCREIRNQTRNDIQLVRNDRLHRINVNEHDTLIRWGCTAQVPIRRVINKSEAIHEVNDKLGFRRKLNESELCPRTWFHQGEDILDYRAYQERFPVVVRPERHAQGRRLYVCDSQDELLQAVRRCEHNWYASELINKVEEYRVFVVQGRVACVARKHARDPNEVAWNVDRGGYFENVRWDQWPLRAVKRSIEAFNLSSLDFGGVDVMVNEGGRAYILEINSAPSLTSPYRQECMSKCIDWLLDHGTDRIPLMEERGGYGKFIHPAVCERAYV